MPSKYIKLITHDKHQFIISRDSANVSQTIKAMLETSMFKESSTNKIQLEENALIMNKICEYFYYNLKYNSNNDEDGDIPEFEIPTEMALELLVASDYFNC
ncbi:hypothetical protein WICPIJ_007587 [Wickerhamomyces pijperi]|uniref:Elongin-C n=1 Tax=Wickerhamomyces pijperi TaxID=599730 RepID=A0A9P8Q1D4_WICPI|nr:hypothetical protein WICPIJ_007587 [Wickerhamomyces pijperi]